MQLQDTIWHYVVVVRRWYTLILFGVIVSTGATCVISLCMTPIYQASSLIKVRDLTTTNGDVLNDQALAVSYSLLITSPDVLQAAARQLPGTTVSQLKNAVSDSPVDNTEIIEVRARAGAPQEAANIANTVANVFIELQVTQEETRLQNEANQYSQNLERARSDINSAQQQLTTLQNSHAPAESIAHQQDLLTTYQSNYSYLLTTYYQLQTQKLQSSNMLTIAQAAVPPTRPDSPQVALNALLALLLSLLLMIVLALLLDWIDATIKTSEDVSQLTTLEPLGSVPFDATASLSVPALLPGSGAVAEAFAAVGTTFRTLVCMPRSILVTGTRAGAGTSTTAIHLALALVHAGMRVLLVDANLRRPVLHKVFQCDNGRGITNDLIDVHLFRKQSSGLSSLWLHQWKTPIPNLWLFPAGPRSSYSAVVLRSPEPARLQRWLLGQHVLTSGETLLSCVDYIIYDSAPLTEGSDTLALAAITEATILVVEAGKEQKETLARVQTTLQRTGSPVAGVVVNRQKKWHGTYFYARQPFSLPRASALDNVDRHATLAASPTLLNTPEVYLPKSDEQPVFAAPPIQAEAPEAYLLETPLPQSLRNEPCAPGERDTPPFLQPMEELQAPRMQFGPRLWISQAGIGDKRDGMPV